jgi:phosphinothricin acetyltransferase
LIRPARDTDAEAIATIWNAIIRDTALTFTSVEKDPARLAAQIADQPFLVAEAKGEVRGFATYAPFRSGPGYARTMEHSIHVADGARGAGLGRALMAACEAHARAAGTHSLIAGISGENGGGIAFHAALGFREVGRLPQVGRKFERWHDLVLMQKFL